MTTNSEPYGQRFDSLTQDRRKHLATPMKRERDMRDFAFGGVNSQPPTAPEPQREP